MSADPNNTRTPESDSEADVPSTGMEAGTFFRGDNMKGEDKVDLVFVTPHNFMWARGMLREDASDLIRNWYHLRDLVFKGEATEEQKRWLTHGTFAINDLTKNRGEDFANWAVGWEHVIGMYIREPEQAVNLTEAQRQYFETMSKVAKKYGEEMGKGEDWKGE